MKTFKGTATLDFKIVLTAEFILAMRHQAQQDDATPFLKLVQAEHPVNDEAFIERIIKNGIRIGIQHDLGQRLHTTPGMGGTVSPVKLEVIGIEPDHDAPAHPQVIERKQQAMAQAGEIYE